MDSLRNINYSYPTEIGHTDSPYLRTVDNTELKSFVESRNCEDDLSSSSFCIYDRILYNVQKHTVIRSTAAFHLAKRKLTGTNLSYLCVPAYCNTSVSNNEYRFRKCNIWGMKKLKCGMEMIRMLIRKSKSVEIVDYYDVSKKYFEVPKTAQNCILKGLNYNEQLCRNIISYLSPCVSESCYIWANYSNRHDRETNTHVSSCAQYKERMIVYKQHLSESVEHLKSAVGIFPDFEDDLKAKIAYVHTIENKIEQLDKNPISFQLDSVYVDINELEPCFGILIYLRECARVFNIPIEERVLRIMRFAASPFSRTSVKSCVTRGQLNLLIYANNYYKEKMGYHSVGHIEKYPKYDHVLDECMAFDKMLWKYNVSKFYDKAPKKYIIITDQNTLFSIMKREGAVITKEYVQYYKEKYTAMEIPKRALKRINVGPSIVDSMIEQKTYIRSNTILVFPDGSELRANYVTKKSYRSMLNRCINNFNNHLKTAIGIVDSVLEDDRYIKQHRKSYAYTFSLYLLNHKFKSGEKLSQRVYDLDKQIEADEKQWKQNAIEREERKQAELERLELERRNLTAANTWIAMEDESDY